jgi:hypothetical protein
MEEYLELIKLVMGFSVHIKDPVEVIQTVSSIKSHLFEKNDDKQYYGMQVVDDSIRVTYADNKHTLRMELLIKVETQYGE